MAKPGSAIKCGKPSEPHNILKLLYLSKRLLVLSIVALRAIVELERASYYKTALNYFIGLKNLRNFRELQRFLWGIQDIKESMWNY